MADDKEEKARPIIIIKKVKKVAHAHHGGAWKVAYADFVTAMMAFFLLLWLLQATTEEQKLGIADYFAPASVARNTSGSGGLLGGRTFTKKGANPHDYTPVGVIIKLPTNPPDWDNTGDPVENTATEETGAGGGDGDAPEQPNEAELEEILAEREAEQFAEAERALREAIESVPELESLVNNLVIDQTPEGMRIQIVDEEGKSMFPSGSAKMFEHTRKLITLVVDAVRTLPQRIAVKGHTDAAPFVNDNGYSNWELSTDRANSSRRALIAAGLRPARIASVVGLADTEHLDEDNPLSPRNRRISIVLLRENAFAPKAGKATKKQSAAAE
ncbi:MAG: flagellar motor protein MotB [Proteobacteria bacterium]|nr:flagellar motor protein MotB [Pseudomonadota bacterium]